MKNCFIMLDAQFLESFDQIIFEVPINGYPSWIHVSYRPDGKNRKQALIYINKKYIPYVGNEHLIKNPDLDK